MAHPSPSSTVSTDGAPDPLDPFGGPDPLQGLRPLAPESPRERWERWWARARRSPLRLVGAALGVLVVAAVAWWLLRPPAPPIESALPLASSSGSSGSSGDGSGGGSGASTGAGAGTAGDVGVGSASSTTAAPDLVVQASGAVAHPGVYRLAAGARVDDVVRAAGGLGPQADADRVNLAAPVADGERVWIPRTGEDAPPDVVAGGGGGTSTGSGAGTGGAGSGGAGSTAPAGPVDLNQATAEQLDTLPGVGPATATAILAYRDEHGPFTSVDDLLEVRGIGDAKLEQLRPLVTV
ncbi:ComEA family DNA-binding protein [Aquihabitans sp. G128]|uniref:ComEA family DNA-binding protein n=1 Tax=Aquihabitans sp. G128 TaxID=2849779 RepID=UPI001C210E57|nr:ComEA family DNA-binding protein [Aquihabitans sp. G128]QXC61543.1 ComEA family DNA-binding protein [Aquihabitans sp. G128]